MLLFYTELSKFYPAGIQIHLKEGAQEGLTLWHLQETGGQGQDDEGDQPCKATYLAHKAMPKPLEMVL